MATALAYCRDRRHAPSVLRLHRPAGQRQLGRPERDARPQRHHELATGSASAAATASRPPSIRPTTTSSITESQDGTTNRYDLRGRTRPEHPSERGRRARTGRRRWRRRGRRRGRAGGRGAAAASGAAARRAGAAARRRSGGQARLRRTRRRAQRAQRDPRRRLPLQLEHAGHHVAAQPEHRLARRQPAVQVVQPAATRGSRARI